MKPSQTLKKGKPKGQVPAVAGKIKNLCAVWQNLLQVARDNFAG
jgi:hypothetical protein